MATPRLAGNSLKVHQADTITVAGTWAAADTCTVTINGKSLVLTVGATVTTAAVATAIKEMINGDTITGDATRSDTGDKVGEFKRLTASVDASVVTVTTIESDKGKPFTMTVTESTAGSGTATEATATAAQSPHHFNDTDNWSTGSVPVDSDTVVFDATDQGLFYDLDQNGVTPAAIDVMPGFNANVGLPELNRDDSTEKYFEYRDTYLALGNSGDAVNTAITIDNPNFGRFKLNSGTGQVTMVVSNTGTRAEANYPSFIWKGTHASNALTVMKGDVGVAVFGGETAHLATLNVGWLENQASDSRVWLGDGVDITNAAINQTGGELTIDSTTSSGTIVVLGGELTILGAAHASIVIGDGGTVYYRGTGTCTICKVYGGGTLDMRRDDRARTFTDLQLFDDASYFDPNDTVTVTNGIDMATGKTSPARMRNFIIGTGKTLTLS